MAHQNRPTLTERYDIFKTLVSQISEMNEDIAALQLAYDQTNNEVIFGLLTKKKRLKEMSYDEFWELENAFRELEIEEFWKNPGRFPDSVRDWFIYYRDKELG